MRCVIFQQYAVGQRVVVSVQSSGSCGVSHSHFGHRLALTVTGAVYADGSSRHLPEVRGESDCLLGGYRPLVGLLALSGVKDVCGLWSLEVGCHSRIDITLMQQDVVSQQGTDPSGLICLWLLTERRNDSAVGKCWSSAYPLIASGDMLEFGVSNKVHSQSYTSTTL